MVTADAPSSADVLITRGIFSDEVISPLTVRFRVTCRRSDTAMPRAELMRQVGGIKALISFGDRIDEQLFRHARRLKVVATFAVGFDNIDVAAATRCGVWVANTPDVVTGSTADTALLLLLAVLRRAGEGYEQIRHGHWTEVSPAALWGEDPDGLTLGVLGLGRIGRALVRRAAPLGMRSIYHDPVRLSPEDEASLGVRWVDFGELLETCDVLSIHVPLSAATRGMVGRSELRRMKQGSFIVNAARGPIVDEEALIEALQSGHIAGAGLDVFAREPDVPAALREHPRAFCLPHVGTATRPTSLAMMKLCVDNVIAVLEGGTPLTPVNRILIR